MPLRMFGCLVVLGVLVGSEAGGECMRNSCGGGGVGGGGGGAGGGGEKGETMGERWGAIGVGVGDS